MITVTILYPLTVLIGIGIIGSKMSDYTAPIANAFGKAVGEWGYIVIIIGMLLSIFGVAFISSFNAPSLVASLAEEHNLVPQWVGKKNRYKAPWIAIIMSAIITALLTTQSYIFLVSCIVLASFVQYVPSIFAVMKFKHNGQYPNKGFKLPGGYLIPVIALLVSCYLVFNFTWKTFLVGIVVAVLAALLYLFSGRKRKDPNPGVPAENNK